jgi:hypothetical protein
MLRSEGKPWCARTSDPRTRYKIPIIFCQVGAPDRVIKRSGTSEKMEVGEENETIVENVCTEQRRGDDSCSDARKSTHFYSKSCSVWILTFISLSCVSNTYKTTAKPARCHLIGC